MPACVIRSRRTGDVFLRIPKGAVVDRINSQVAVVAPAAGGMRLRAGTGLASHVRKFVKKHGIQRITFTAVPDSAATRSIASLAKQMFGRTLTTGARLPRSISSREREFYLLP